MRALSDRLFRWREAAGVYRDRRVLAITFLGISSGLPLGILGDPLTAWLVDHGLSLTTVGLFALAGLPYSFKFLWAPLLDHLRPPGFMRRLGRRRGWAVVIQAALLASIAALGLVRPDTHILLAGIATLAVAFFSASQDIVIDAYRVEILEERKLGAGAATVVFGYRFGQIGAGAFGLLAASTIGWTAAFIVLALVVLVGMATFLLNPEPDPPADVPAVPSRPAGRVEAARRLFARSVVAPFADFLARRDWLAILALIVFYKLGDAVLSVMQTPFFLDIGFTKPEIAGIKKGVGFAAVIGGGLLGGIMVARYGILRSLLVCGILQAVSNLVFVWQAWAGHDLSVLTATVAMENVASGMGSTAFVAWLSSLCTRAYTATQYALLTSVMGGARTTLSASAGWLADHMDWISFFALTALAALPGLGLVVWLIHRNSARPALAPAPAGTEQ